MLKHDQNRCGVYFSDSGDDIELASCPHGQPSKEFSMVASCSCELLSEGGLPHVLSRFQHSNTTECIFTDDIKQPLFKLA